MARYPLKSVSKQTSPFVERRGRERIDGETLLVCRRAYQKGEAVYLIRNISDRGLLFEAPEEIAPGSRLKVEFYAPMCDEKCRRIYTRIGVIVQWTSEIPGAFEHEGSNRYRMGVAFEQIESQP